jgi:hypothetical protein
MNLFRLGCVIIRENKRRMLIVEKQSFRRLRSSGMHRIVHEYVEVDICHGFTEEKNREWRGCRWRLIYHVHKKQKLTSKPEGKK